MTTMSKTERELDLLVLEDLEFETACEGNQHASGGRGHDPSQSATHYVKCPECGCTIFICAGRATYIRTLGSTPFGDRISCGKVFLADEWEIGRIPGK